MDGRFRPRTVTSRPATQRGPVERKGNVLRLRFGVRPDPVRVPTTAWYHAEAIRQETEHDAGQDAGP